MLVLGTNLTLLQFNIMTKNQLDFVKFVLSLDENQLDKYFLMLGPEDTAYVQRMITEVSIQVQMAIAELNDEVERLDDAGVVLGNFTLSVHHRCCASNQEQLILVIQSLDNNVRLCYHYNSAE